MGLFTAKTLKHFKKNGFFCIVLVIFSSNSHGAELNIMGNENLSSRKIKALLSVPKSFEKYEKYEIRRWIYGSQLDIGYAYENLGYLDAGINIHVYKDTLKNRAKWNVNVAVQEGPRYVFGNVNLVLADDSKPLVKKKDLKTRPDEFINPEYPADDKRHIEKIYGNKGFAKRQVKVDYQINDSVKTVDVNFLVDPSYMVVFDALVVRNKREKQTDSSRGLSNETFIRRIFKIEKGDTVNLSEANEFKARLKSTRAFNYVRLKDSLIAGEINKSVLTLALEERVPGRISNSLFWETEDGFGVESGLNHKNLLGKFYGGKINVRLAQRKQSVSLGMTNPLLFGRRLRLDNNLVLIWRDEPRDYESDFDAIFTSSLSRYFAKWMRFSGTLEFEGTRSLLEFKRVINLNTYGTLALLFIDNELNPNRGSKFAFTLGNGGPFIDKNNEFKFTELRHNWLEIKSSYFYPLSWFSVGALRLDGGVFSRDGGDNSKRFFLGGRKSIRNKDFREICPERVLRQDSSSADCSPDVTPVYYLMSFELRLRILSGIDFDEKKSWKKLKQLQVVPFTDYGRIWDYGAPVKEEGKGFDVGLGIRLPLLVFNFRFDYAVGWNGGPDFDDYRFIIDLTQAF